jgi:hypothetical protein
MKIQIKTDLTVFFFLSIFVLAGSLGIAGTNLSNSPNWESTSGRITVDPLGNIHVAWAEYYSDTTGDAFYAKYDVVSKQWSAPLNISGNSQVNSGDGELRAVGIASDSYGNVYVTYVDLAAHKVWLRILQGGAWGTPIEVVTSNGACDNPRVAVDGSGNVFLTWWDRSLYRIFSRARIGGAWESVKEIGPAMAKYPDIAVGNNRVVCAWVKRDPYEYQVFYAQRGKSFDAPWTDALAVVPSVEGQQSPAVELDDSDVAHIIWTPRFDDGQRTVRYAHSTGSGFSAPVDISKKTLLHYPALYERGGNVYADWQVGGVPWGSSMNYNHRISGTWNGEGEVPNSDGGTLCDIATSPAQDKAYYVFDSDGEIVIETQVLFAAGPPPDYETYAIGDFDGDGKREGAVDFGTAGLMLWKDNNWTRLTSDNPDGLLASDVDHNSIDELIGDFGGLGLWAWVFGAWHQISPVNAESMISGNINGNGGKQLVCDFGSVGLWVWDGFGWAMLTGVNPEQMICSDIDGSGDDEIIVDFGSLGVWARGDGVWSRLSGADVDFLTSGNLDGYGGKEVIGDFGSFGLWAWNAGTWHLMSGFNPDALLCADVYGNGADELVGDFGSAGMWFWSNNVWFLLSYYNPQAMIAANTDGDGDSELIGDFGTLGLFHWDSGAWSLLYAADAQDIAALDLDEDGDDEVLADFGSGGLWLWSGGVWTPVLW